MAVAGKSDIYARVPKTFCKFCEARAAFINGEYITIAEPSCERCQGSGDHHMCEWGYLAQEMVVIGTVDPIETEDTGLKLNLEWVDNGISSAEAEVPLGLIYISLDSSGHYHIEMGGKVLESTTKTLAEAKALATELYSDAIEDLILFHSNAALQI